MTAVPRACLALLLYAPLFACDTGTAPRPTPNADTTQATVTFATAAGEVTVQVEVADTPAERTTGLMYRETLDPYRGMVFVFPTEEVLSFWMKNTYIPLDMIFVDHAFEVVGVVANAEPLTLDPRSVGVPSMYVVEVNAGFAAEHGIAAGTRLTMQGVPSSVPY